MKRPKAPPRFRSQFEAKVAADLKAAGVAHGYEQRVLPYVRPATACRYTPDFTLANGIIIETKGRFLAQDRAKHLLVRAQHPEMDIRFVFLRSAEPIRKGSKTTCADWCRKHGFLYADKSIPPEWLAERMILPGGEPPAHKGLGGP